MASRKRRVIEIPDDYEQETAPKHHYGCGMVLFAVVFAIIALPVVLKLMGFSAPPEQPHASLTGEQSEGLLDTLLRLEETLFVATVFIRDALLTVLGWIMNGLGWIGDGITWVANWLRQLPDAAQPN